MRWNEGSAGVFIEKARKDILEDAKSDATEIRLLVHDEQKLRDMLLHLQDNAWEFYIEFFYYFDHLA
jgi:hypothetical protein